MSYGDIATQYARDVAEGRIPGCKWHRLACARHLKDLQRVGSEGFPYVFNPELHDSNGKAFYPGERICIFAGLMPHIKGDWAKRGQLIKLEPWQIFILVSIFGWVHGDTGNRRFRKADLFVPRKNAKSTLAAVIGLYLLAVDEEFGAEIYSGATSEDQALEVFLPAVLMARATANYRHKYGVTVPSARRPTNMSVTKTNSKFEPLIGNPGDGASPSCAIVDEFHEHKTPELYDTMETGMLARSQPLLLVITTSGTDIAGPCFMHQKELEKILEGLIDNDQRFGIIFTIDEKDDWTDPASLIKANPNFGVSIDKDIILQQLRDAIGDSRKQNTFKTKHLNIWVGAASPWLNLYNLQRCGDPSLRLETFAGESGVVGLDLASKQDIASAVWMFTRVEDDGETHSYAISRNYVPAAALQKPENAHYQGWVNSGHLIATPGSMIDLQQIEDDVRNSAGTLNIAEVAKDPWGGHQLGSNLENDGFTVVDIPQTTQHLSEPMKMIEAEVDAGDIGADGAFVHKPRFHHDGNPCFVWQLSNVEVDRTRPNETYFPRKLRDSNKIDAGVATIIAKNRALVAEPGGSIYNGRGIVAA